MTKPIIHYSQICNILIQEGEFRKKIEEKTLSLMFKYDFEVCRISQSLIQFHIYLNSQQDQQLVSNDFLKELKAKLESQDELKYKKVVNYYMSFCCLLGYHKQIIEKLDEGF